MPASTVRVPTELYQKIRKIKLSLEHDHYSAAPSLQDFITVAIQRLVRDWETREQQEVIIQELLRNRQLARSRMGKNS